MMQHKKSIFYLQSHHPTTPQTPLKQQQQQQADWNKDLSGGVKNVCIISIPSYTFSPSKVMQHKNSTFYLQSPPTTLLHRVVSPHKMTLKSYPKSTGKSSDSKSTSNPPKQPPKKTSRLKQGRIRSQKGQ